MAWEENSRICLHMQLIAILSRTGVRMYDQILGCWTSVDPMAEKYYHISPYVFCFDIPVRMVDRDGKDPWDLPMMLRPQEEQKILRLNNKTYE